MINLEASDNELIAHVGRRSAEAFEELYRRHAPAVQSLIRRLFGDPDVAKEVTDDAFMRLWEHAHDLRKDGRLRAWLTTVSHNAALDRFRRKRISTDPLADAFDRSDERRGPPDEAIMKEQQREIRAALLQLAESQRNAIELAYFRGWTQGQIASFTGEPLGTIKGRIRLGMKRLRALMERDGGLVIEPSIARPQLQPPRLGWRTPTSSYCNADMSAGRAV
jgi:RNA polymerase sigma factor (sigma-70 family)